MAASRVRELFDKGTDAFNRHDVQGFTAQMAGDVTLMAPGVGGELKGKAAVSAFYQGWLDAFPDAKVEIDAVQVLDDMAIEEGHFVGTHRGTLHTASGDLPATGRKVRGDYMQIVRFRGDQIASFHLVFDRMDLFEQLGLAPTAEAEEPTRMAGEQPGMQTH
jgi:predicted ester cyclase